MSSIPAVNAKLHLVDLTLRLYLTNPVNIVYDLTSGEFVLYYKVIFGIDKSRSQDIMVTR